MNVTDFQDNPKNLKKETFYFWPKFIVIQEILDILWAMKREQQASDWGTFR